MKFLLFVSVLTLGQLVSCANVRFIGTWIEDESLRTGLNDYLWARGVGWFKRQYATSMVTWQYEQTISYSNGYYHIRGFKGPLREAFNYALKPDNSTVTMIDLGSSLGGMRACTAAHTSSRKPALISYCKDPTTNVVDVVSTREIDPNDRNVMYFKSKDIPYGYEMVATMRRQS